MATTPAAVINIFILYILYKDCQIEMCHSYITAIYIAVYRDNIQYKDSILK